MQGKSYHLLDCFSSIFNVNVFCFLRHLLHETPIKFKIINYQGTKLPFKTIYIQKTFCNISRLKIWILQRKKVTNKQISSMASVCFSSVLISVYSTVPKPTLFLKHAGNDRQLYLDCFFTLQTWTFSETLLLPDSLSRTRTDVELQKNQKKWYGSCTWCI